MSDLTFNKIAGAVLATGLAIVGLKQLSSGVFTSEPPAKPGYAVEVAAEGGEGAAAADVPPDWGTVLKTADVAAGEATFAKCQSCHSLTANGTGPNLTGVVGRKPGAEAGFSYSPAMSAFGGKTPIWDYDHLYEFLKSPQAYVQGTKMTFVGLKQPQDRVNVIAFLHTKGSSLPIPAPDPKRAAGAAAPGAAAPGQPTSTGSTAGAGVVGQGATAHAGGPSGQGPGAPAQQQGSSAAAPTSAAQDVHKPQ